MGNVPLHFAAGSKNLDVASHVYNLRELLVDGAERWQSEVKETLFIDGGTLKIILAPELVDQTGNQLNPTRITLIKARDAVGRFDNVEVHAENEITPGKIEYFRNRVDIVVAK